MVREAAQGAVAIFGGGMTETLKTLGTIDRILFLRQVPLFNHLTPEDLQQIAEIATERIFPPGEYLCREGDLGDELFVIVEGQVRVTKGANGAVRTLRTLRAGDHIGELAILREGPRSASVVAENGDVRALVIACDAFKAILRDRPEVAMAMLASLAERLSTL
jgi:CRP-like cAMP-binding protein